jgi:integrase
MSADLTIGRLRGGFCVHWTDLKTGKRRRYQLAARTREEAESEARERYLRETWSAGSVRVSDLWAAYIQHLGSKPTATTMGYTGKAVLAAFGALRPSQITVQDCRAYLQARLAAGKKIGTIWTELGHLRSTLRYAHKMGLIDRMPYIELPPKPDSTVAPRSGDELQRLVDGASSPHIRLAIILLIATGARAGAILDLTWDRIDFARGVIDLRLPDGVTRKGRAVVPMNRMARAALETAYQARLSDYVVEWAGDRVKSIRTGFKAAMARAEMERFHIHQIRHSVAVRMLAAGLPIEKVSQFLGHSTIQITQKTYARFMPEHLADAAEIMDLGFIEPARTSQRKVK